MPNPRNLLLFQLIFDSAVNPSVPERLLELVDVAESVDGLVAAGEGGVAPPVLATGGVQARAEGGQRVEHRVITDFHNFYNTGTKGGRTEPSRARVKDSS